MESLVLVFCLLLVFITSNMVLGKEALDRHCVLGTRYMLRAFYIVCCCCLLFEMATCSPDSVDQASLEFTEC